MQGHMWYLQSTEEFKQKFPEIAEKQEDSDSDPSFTVRFKSGADQRWKNIYRAAEKPTHISKPTIAH